MSRPTIAVIGASANRSKFGNICVRAYAAKNYDVFPVHPRAASIEGFPAYRQIADVPVPRLDRISIYLPKDICLTVLPQLLQKPAGAVWFNPGADDPEVIALARELGLCVVIGCSIVDIQHS
jgi:predicted CoA-binding protein